MEEKFTPTPQEIECACQGSLPEQVVTGLELFNAGEYFEAHEVLELAWRAETGAVRELYRGILQVGVAYYHIQRGNFRGAVKMLQRSHTWLDPFPATCRGIDVARFRDEYHRVEAALWRLGERGMDGLDHSMFRPVSYHKETTS